MRDPTERTLFPFRRTRVAFKVWLARHRLIIEFCKECGRTQPLVWWCDDDALWERIWGTPGGGGVLCPGCFDRRATADGMLLIWRPEVHCGN